MRLRYVNGGAQVLGNRFPLTPQRLQAMVTYAGIAAGTPVVYRVEDDRTYDWREPHQG